MTTITRRTRTITITRDNIQSTFDTEVAESMAVADEFAKSIAEMAGRNATAENLAAEVNDYARANGRTKAMRRVSSIVKYGLTHNEPTADIVAEAISELQDALCEGADDTWSGRRNDVARAEFDGFRAGAKVALRWLDRVTV